VQQFSPLTAFVYEWHVPTECVLTSHLLYHTQGYHLYPADELDTIIARLA
jgi:hypothetical protein